MTTAERASLIANYCQSAEVESFLGYFAAIDLVQWVEHELGSVGVLDGFEVVREGLQSMAVPNDPVLHVLSGNTPHAGLQSLVRGLLVGALNWVKLPSSGLPAVEKWIGGLPAELRGLVKVVDSIETSITAAKVVVAIGADETMDAILERMRPHQRFIPHGHKLSIGLIDKPSRAAAELAVKDACSFNQQGCLSLHTVYAREGARDFLPLLAEAMEEFERREPRGEISFSESGAITNLRETVRYEAANDPENYALLHSDGDTCWTAIYRNSPLLIASPLNRVISVQPWPENPELLGSEFSFISTLAVEENSAILACVDGLDIPRVCPLGRSQQPSLFWHHDGFAPLSSLIRWRDRELWVAEEGAMKNKVISTIK